MEQIPYVLYVPSYLANTLQSRMILFASFPLRRRPPMFCSFIDLIPNPIVLLLGIVESFDIARNAP